MKSINLPVNVTDFFAFTIDDYSHIFEAFYLMQQGILKGFNSESFTVISGNEWTVLESGGVRSYTSTEGYISYNNELFFVPAQVLEQPIIETEIPVYSIVTISEPNEPRQLSGTVNTIAVRQERQMITALLGAGSGIVDYNNVDRININLLDLSQLDLSNRLQALEADTGWVNVTDPNGANNQSLLNGWINPFASSNVRYRKIKNRVQLGGSVKGDSASSNLVFSLPSGFFNPNKSLAFPFSISGAAAAADLLDNIKNVTVTNTGSVLISGFGAFTWNDLIIDLDNISFLID